MKKYTIKGMTCAVCSRHIEKAVVAVDGVEKCEVNLISNTMIVDGTFENKAVIKAVKKAGYLASDENEYAKNKSYKIWISAVFLSLLMYISMAKSLGFPFFQELLEDKNIFYYILLQISCLAPIVGMNFYFFKSGFVKLIKFKPNMDSLVAIGASVSILYGVYTSVDLIVEVLSKGSIASQKNLYFDSAGAILTFVSFGKYIEGKSKNKTSQAIKLLLDLSGKKTIRMNEIEEEISVDEIKKDDILKILPGCSIPVDGVIISGGGNIDTSSITGESIPVYKGDNDEVVSGTINTDGLIMMKAFTTTKDSTLSKIVEKVEQASNSKAPISKIADKVSAVFIPIVFVLSLITFTVWVFFAGFDVALSYAISILVISCPCSLGLATPIAVMVSTGVAAKNHILIKNATALEHLHSITTVVFDKTGTITKGELEVKKIVSIDNDFLSILGSLEKNSIHPIANAINNYIEIHHIDTYAVEDYINEAGMGVKGVINGISYFCGSERYLANTDIDIDYENCTGVFVASDHLLGYILVGDETRETSKISIAMFKRHGIKTVMLTGDNRYSSNVVAEEVLVDETISDVLPIDKADVIDEISRTNRVLMVGDGINDAIAMKKAYVSCAIGAGSDIAMESSDIILSRNELLDVYSAYLLSRKTINNIKMSLFWAFFYNIISIPIAGGVLSSFGIVLNPMISSLAMSLSSICVVLNALRLLNFKGVEYGKNN